MSVQLNDCLVKPGTKVRLKWSAEPQSTWTEICAWTVEKFGLPGTRYMWHPTPEHMIFEFVDEEDAIMLILRWS